MSHELRTPLNAIIGYSRDAARGGHGPRASRSFGPDLEKIYGAGKHLLALINDILDLSKIESGKMDLFLEDFDVRALVRDVQSTIHPLVAKNQNRLEVQLRRRRGRDARRRDPRAPGPLQPAEQRLQVHGEGHDHRGRAPRRDAPTRRRCSSGSSDTGIGLTAEQLGKLFQAFTQADASTSRTLRRHGPRPRHQPPLLPDDGRRHRGHERAREGLGLHRAPARTW